MTSRRDASTPSSAEVATAITVNTTWREAGRTPTNMNTVAVIKSDTEIRLYVGYDDVVRVHKVRTVWYEKALCCEWAGGLCCGC